MRPKKILSIAVIMFLCIQYSLTVEAGQRVGRYRYDKFQPGDAVRIEIMEIIETQGASSNLDVSDDYSIGRDGTIQMPLVGKIKVVGLNRESLIELLAQKYSPYFREPFITVSPLIRVVLMGAFNKPGSYRIPPDASLWELIDDAGGPAPDCDLGSLRVERGGKVVIKNLLSSFENGHSLSDIGIRSGDQIIAKDKNKIGMRQIMDYTRFGISLVLLYLQIQNLSK